MLKIKLVNETVKHRASNTKDMRSQVEQELKKCLLLETVVYIRSTKHDD